MAKNPTFAHACVRDGHEIAAHGYRWLDLWEMTVSEDLENIQKALTTLKEVTGEMPVGCYFGRGTPNTRGLFPEAWKGLGKKMLYCSEAYNDDVPYWIDLPAEEELPEDEREGMLIVPYNYDCNGKISFLFLFLLDRICERIEPDQNRW
jgi:peptidoglycan/xylan/chitin deacetylase (PgdA/CDA1 family)